MACNFGFNSVFYATESRRGSGKEASSPFPSSCCWAMQPSSSPCRSCRDCPMAPFFGFWAESRTWFNILLSIIFTTLNRVFFDLQSTAGLWFSEHTDWTQTEKYPPVDVLVWADHVSMRIFFFSLCHPELLFWACWVLMELASCAQAFREQTLQWEKWGYSI